MKIMDSCQKGTKENEENLIQTLCDFSLPYADDIDPEEAVRLVDGVIFPTRTRTRNACLHYPGKINGKGDILLDTTLVKILLQNT